MDYYARAMLMLYKDWCPPFEYTGSQAVDMFHKVLGADEFPIQVTLPFACMQARDACQVEPHEPVSSDLYCFDYSHGNDIPDDLQQLIQWINTLPKTIPEESNDPAALDFGLTHNWSVPSYPVSIYWVLLFLHHFCFSHVF